MSKASEVLDQIKKSKSLKKTEGGSGAGSGGGSGVVHGVTGRDDTGQPTTDNVGLVDTQFVTPVLKRRRDRRQLHKV